MPPTRPLRRAFVLSVACTLALLTGCGRKGPLYLPPPPPADTGQTQAPPVETEAETPPKAEPAAATSGG